LQSPPLPLPITISWYQKKLNNPLLLPRDHTQTLSQNYTRLGLARKLNAPTGGVERNPVGGITPSAHIDPSQQQTNGRERLQTDSLNIASGAARRNAALIPRDVRIERDPETGAIVRVIEDSDSQEEEEEEEEQDGRVQKQKKKKAKKSTPWKPLNDPLAAYDSDSDSAASRTSSFASFHSSASASSAADTPINTTRPAPNQHHLPSASSLADLQNEQSANPSSIVAQLAAHARATTVKPRKRTVSVREEDWMRRLVEAHGEDYGAMVGDRALNVRQQTRGDIERRVRRWREGGGK